MRKRGFKRLILLIIPFFLILLTSAESFSQQNPYKRRHSAKMPRNRKMKIICPVFIPNEYPYQGIGIKVGDPFAFTYKLYLSEYFGMEVDIGNGASFLYKKFFKSNFVNFDGLDTLNYLGHSVKNDFVGQFRFMIHTPIETIKGLDLYLGGGYQFKNTEVLYRYNDPANGFAMEQEARRSQFFYGPDAFLGAEYANFDIPVSLFVEANMFFIIEANGLGPRFQAVAGIRYIF